MTRLDLPNLSATSHGQGGVTSCYRAGVGTLIPRGHFHQLHAPISEYLFAFCLQIEPTTFCGLLLGTRASPRECREYYVNMTDCCGRGKDQYLCLEVGQTPRCNLYFPWIRLGTFSCSRISHILFAFSPLNPASFHPVASIFSSIFLTNQLLPREARTSEHLLNLTAP
ncbi:unnamed protein product [Rangifer tarandus platyrhynchus]|uniref:Uncharacterized protein n=2 Tax=Rangifer tarandus platyrhynchus TaxID=3082113 RepID=A0AC59YX13_RANTA|nr:unnamed protein product [Rangifer tarandus platyrhynchus]